MTSNTRVETRRRRKRRLFKIGFKDIVIVVLAVLLVASILQTRKALSICTESMDLAIEAQQRAKEAIEALETMTEDTSEETAAATSEAEADLLSFESEGERMTVTATAYCSCVKCCGIWSDQHPSRIGTGYEQKTASGTRPTQGRTIAVDPEVIPLGSRVIIGGQEYVAEDTGSAVKGNHIDIYFSDHQAACEWGKQTIEVIVLAD